MNGSTLRLALVVLAFTGVSAPAFAQSQEDETTPVPATEETAPAPSIDDERPAPPPAVDERRYPADTTRGVREARTPDRRETFGAVMAPAALPSGAQAGYVYIGVQELGVGYRQGVGIFELEGRGRFNYLLLSLSIEGVAKWAAYRDSRIEVAPYLGVGFVLDTGARYFEPANFAHLGLKLLAGATLTYRFNETLRGIANLEIPYDLSLTTNGGNIFNPLAGVGVEIYLGQDISALALGSLGYSGLKEPLAVPAGRVGYQLRLGLGYRFF
ncbi:MAG: hypothetical protein ACT4TC_01845 [Myxococcaceae bacterium]